ncbi:MAG: hypothetical protein J1F31_03415 [Erysipelotrichales bacterium]|nr:hypothetical protein [Erysipelotrichales bacterium]
MIKKLVLVFTILPYAIPTVKANRFKDIYITPISDNTIISFSYVVGLTSEVNFSIYIEYQNEPRNYLYSNKVNITFNFSDEFLLFKEHVKENSYLVFEAKSSNSSSYIKFDLKTQNNNHNLLEQSTFYLEDAIQYIDDRETIHYANETIEFNDLSGELDLTLPYLFYDHICFTKSSYFFQEELPIEKIVMKISDKNNIFPLLNHEGDYAIVNFELTNKNDRYFLSLLDKIYVYNDSLILSSSPKEGFVRTSYLYIPKNCSETEFEITFCFKNLGIQKLNCYYRYILHRKKRYVGGCSTSLNCVKIDESNNYFDTNETEVLV